MMKVILGNTLFTVHITFVNFTIPNITMAT